MPAPRQRAPKVPFDEELAIEICEHIALGKSLRSFCRIEGNPAVGSVYRWLSEYPEFRDHYARAREDQADSYADEIIDIADEEEDPVKARVRIDARKWVSSKLKPKKYGDRVQLAGEQGNPIQHNVGVSWMTEAQAKARGWE